MVRPLLPSASCNVVDATRSSVASAHGRVFVRGWTITRTVARGLLRHHAFDHAATMAFYFFLGMIPLFVFGGLLVGNVLEREGVEALAAPLYRVMPGPAAALVRSELEKIAAAHAKAVAPLSLVGFLWLTTNGIHNLMDVYELLLGAPPRRWFRQRAIATVWVVGGLAIAAAATSLVLIINGAATGLEGIENLPRFLRHGSDFVTKGWERGGVVVLFIALLSVGLATFYRTAVVYPRGVRRRVWPGTVVALLLWVIVSWAFAAYVTTIAHYAVYYGSLATIAVVLLWLYLTSLAFLVGAEVNAHLQEMQRSGSCTPDPEWQRQRANESVRGGFASSAAQSSRSCRSGRSTSPASTSFCRAHSSSA
jgi:membrane protein